MSGLLATVIDVDALAQTALASLIAGVGFTTAFSVGIFSAARMSDLRRADRPVMAFGALVLTLVAAAVVVGGLVLGIIVMTQK